MLPDLEVAELPPPSGRPVGWPDLFVSGRPGGTDLHPAPSPSIMRRQRRDWQDFLPLVRSHPIVGTAG